MIYLMRSNQSASFSLVKSRCWLVHRYSDQVRLFCRLASFLQSNLEWSFCSPHRVYRLQLLAWHQCQSTSSGAGAWQFARSNVQASQDYCLCCLERGQAEASVVACIWVGDDQVHRIGSLIYASCSLPLLLWVQFERRMSHCLNVGEMTCCRRLQFAVWSA